MGIYIAWKQRQSEFSIDSCTSSGYNNAYESISITNVNNSIFNICVDGTCGQSLISIGKNKIESKNKDRYLIIKEMEKYVNLIWIRMMQKFITIIYESIARQSE